MILLEVLKRATGYLEAHGSTSPRLDAEVLLAHSLEIRRLDLYLQFDRLLSDSQLQPYRDLIARRGAGQPVAYLTGVKEFMGIRFEVTPAVLVPNPDTELLVHRAVEWVRERGRPARLADVGTGSGCIAVAVAHFAAQVQVIAGDDSPQALEVARRNVSGNGLEDRVTLVEGDLLAPFPDGLDAILANLPYLAQTAVLPAEVTAQPAHALIGGPAGCELVLRLLEQAQTKLAEGGILLAEIDPTIAEEVTAAAARHYSGRRMHRDLDGRIRLLEAWNS